MAKVSASDLVNAGAGAVSANAASDLVQKTALRMAAVSGITGAARDARSAAMAKGVNSAFSPPSLNFGKTNPNNVRGCIRLALNITPNSQNF